jgi:uncharacterized protein (DUF736 family)
MPDTKNTEWTDREIGALWLNVNQKTQEKYLTGKVNGEKVILFKNKYKSENEKAPDFRMYKQKDQDSSSSSSQAKEESFDDDEDMI